MDPIKKHIEDTTNEQNKLFVEVCNNYSKTHDLTGEVSRQYEKQRFMPRTANQFRFGSKYRTKRSIFDIIGIMHSISNSARAGMTSSVTEHEL